MKEKLENKKESLNETPKEEIENTKNKNKPSRQISFLGQIFKTIKTALYLSLFFIFITLIIGLVYFNNSSIPANNVKYIDLVKLQDKVKTVIENNADLSIIRHIYDEQLKREASYFAYTVKFWKYNYELTPRDKISLNIVLLNIKSEYYFQEIDSSSIVRISKLEKIIQDYNDINPFDKLESQQKYFFENLKIKLDSNYIMIAEDVLKITDELHRKNSLVSEYLSNAKSSFKISIIALSVSSISLILALYFNFFRRKNQSTKAESQTPTLYQEDSDTK